MGAPVPEPGSVNAGDCLHTVDALSDEALVEARSRLNPAAGVMLSALWVASTGQLVLIIHHLAVDAVSWRVLLEDLNIAWAQHHNGQPVALPAGGSSFRGGHHCSPNTPASRRHGPGRHLEAGGGDPGRIARSPTRADTYASAGHLTASLDAETTRRLIGEVPAAFHAGIHDILLIASRWPGPNSSALTSTSIGIDVEGHGRHDDLAATLICRAPWAGSPPNTRWR